MSYLMKSQPSASILDRLTNNIFALLLLFTLTTCQKEVTVDMPDNEQKYVIKSLFQPFTLPYPKSITTSISKTIGFLDSLDFPPIMDADVFLYSDDSLLGKMVYNENMEQYILEGIYNLQPGSYKLEVVHGETVISAHDLLPEKVNILKIEINPLAGYDDIKRAYAQIKLSFKDPEQFRNYYEVSLTNNVDSFFYNLSSDFPPITSETYYPSVLNIDYDLPEYLLFNDEEFNGQEISVPFEYKHPVAPLNGITGPHLVTIHFRSVSQNYYKYRTTVIKQSYLSEPDIIYGQAEPMNVFSNISGQYGVFAGYQSVDISFVIENNEIIEYEF